MKKKIGFFKRKKATLVILFRKAENILFGIALRKAGLFAIQFICATYLFW